MKRILLLLLLILILRGLLMMMPRKLMLVLVLVMVMVLQLPHVIRVLWDQDAFRIRSTVPPRKPGFQTLCADAAGRWKTRQVA